MIRPSLFPVLLLLSGALSAAPVLSSLEGDVTVLRSGVLIPSEKVADGFPLEPFDTVTTGTTGRADLRWSGTPGGLVHLDPRTSLYLDPTPTVQGIELLTGSISARLADLVLDVRTGQGRFQGAGPVFRVVTAASGDVLATASSGRLTGVFPGRTVFIEPGSVVQALVLEQTVQTLPVNVSTLGAFETSWLEQRLQTFRGQAAVAFRVLASRYQLQVSQFQRAWDRVRRETGDLRAAAANLRRSAFPLERSLFAVKALKGLLDNGTLSPTVELNRGYAAKDFFRQASADEALWASRLGEARGIFKVQKVPFASYDAEPITWETDYFH